MAVYLTLNVGEMISDAVARKVNEQAGYLDSEEDGDIPNPSPAPKCPVPTKGQDQNQVKA